MLFSLLSLHACLAHYYLPALPIVVDEIKSKSSFQRSKSERKPKKGSVIRGVAHFLALCHILCYIYHHIYTHMSMCMYVLLTCNVFGSTCYCTCRLYDCQTSFIIIIISSVGSYSVKPKISLEPLSYAKIFIRLL